MQVTIGMRSSSRDLALEVEIDEAEFIEQWFAEANTALS